MSLLNFSKTYAEASKYLTSSDDLYKLIFTGDGHIITHGVDYLAQFGAGQRGVVPGSTGSSTEILRGNGTWSVITTSDLPISSFANAITNGTTSTSIASIKDIIDYVGNNIAASDAMRYKGTISIASGAYVTVTESGTGAFPTSCKIGDTYRVITGGTYAGSVCENGDLLVCIKDGSGDSLNSADYWTIVQTNINGTVSHTINGTSYSVYSPNLGSSFSIYAPTSLGSAGQVLSTTGSGLSWMNQSSITAGDITDAAKQKLLTAVTLASDGTLSITVGGTTRSAVLSGSIVAGSVKQALTAGDGLTLSTTSYDGSASSVMALKTATSTTLGGIKVGDYLAIDDSGKLYVDTSQILNITEYLSSAKFEFANSTNNAGFALIYGTNQTSRKVASSVTLIGGDHTTVNYSTSTSTSYPNGTFTISSSWRDVQVGGISIGEKAVNFVPSGDVYLKTDSNGDDIQDISFGLSWYNISTKEYETA